MIDDVTDRISMTVDELAAACAAEMAGRDAVSSMLGVERLECRAGKSVVAMTIGPEMINSHGIAHSGVIFTLADCAVSLASNSHNERAVAANASIAFLQACRLGDRLIATAREVARQGHTGIYDVRVANGSAVIAEFRATIKIIGGAVIMPK